MPFSSQPSFPLCGTTWIAPRRRFRGALPVGYPIGFTMWWITKTCPSSLHRAMYIIPHERSRGKSHGTHGTAYGIPHHQTFREGRGTFHGITHMGYVHRSADRGGEGFVGQPHGNHSGIFTLPVGYPVSQWDTPMLFPIKPYLLFRETITILLHSRFRGAVHRISYGDSHVINKPQPLPPLRKAMYIHFHT